MDARDAYILEPTFYTCCCATASPFRWSIKTWSETSSVFKISPPPPPSIAFLHQSVSIIGRSATSLGGS